MKTCIVCDLPLLPDEEVAEICEDCFWVKFKKMVKSKYPEARFEVRNGKDVVVNLKLKRRLNLEENRE